MPKDFRAEMEQLRKQQIIDNLASASKSLMDIKATIKRLSDEGSLIDISSQRYHKIYDQLRKLEPQVPVFERRENEARQSYEKEFNPTAYASSVRSVRLGVDRLSTVRPPSPSTVRPSTVRPPSPKEPVSSAPSKPARPSDDFIFPSGCIVSELNEEKNKYCIQTLAYLLDEWTSGTNIFALVEANYLIDYYCTQIVHYCEKELRESKVNPFDTFSKFRDFDHIVSSEFYSINYNDGLLQVQEKIFEIVRAVCDHFGFPLRKGIIPVNWEELLQRFDLKYILDQIYLIFKRFTEYIANAFGLYAFIALKPVQTTIYQINEADKLSPVNCITTSLLLETILMLLNFPRQFIFSVGQRHTRSQDRTKQSHWTTTCLHPFANVLANSGNFHPSMQTIYYRKIDSAESFATYTRDIIFYYKNFLQRRETKKSDHILRIALLENLIKTFDYYFPEVFKIVQSPPTSPTGSVANPLSYQTLAKKPSPVRNPSPTSAKKKTSSPKVQPITSTRSRRKLPSVPVQNLSTKKRSSSPKVQPEPLTSSRRKLPSVPK